MKIFKTGNFFNFTKAGVKRLRVSSLSLSSFFLHFFLFSFLPFFFKYCNFYLIISIYFHLYIATRYFTFLRCHSKRFRKIENVSNFQNEAWAASKVAEEVEKHFQIKVINNKIRIKWRQFTHHSVYSDFSCVTQMWHKQGRKQEAHCED